MRNSIRKYFVGNLVTAAPPQYSSAIRLRQQRFVFRQWRRRLPACVQAGGGHFEHHF